MANAVFLSQALDGLRASIAHLGDVIKQRDLVIANQNEKLVEKDQLIERLQADLDAAEALIHEKDTQLTEGSDAALNELAVKIDQLNDAIAQLSAPSAPVESQPVEKPTEVSPVVEPAPEVVEVEAEPEVEVEEVAE
jgi:chromosome segregation ATPase